MPKRIRLQPATLRDIPTLQMLANRIWWAHYPPIIGEAQTAYMLERMYSAEALRRQMTEENAHFWLINTLSDVSIGFLSISEQCASEYFIHKFYLDVAYQGKGLGTEAFEQLLEQYPAAKRIRLTVNRQNYKSINFYFKLGFRIERCADFDIGEGFFMNDFIMCWESKPKEKVNDLSED
ncbi:MAG: GNAT family N-acetyltransferase [Saprospiraceae bacterium]|nr:GNAT family N-acetyltransferase [Saprospiraceae bacterium]MDW8483215.1 GNAT family N-acetyltransferase [Saprospiraceae bacterium]